MTNVLPQYTGLTVNTVNYKYTAVKLAQDPFVVTVANSNPTNTGYVFRSQDDWTGLQGNTITKTVPVDTIPGILWGSGSITTTGTGTVQDPEVRYGYRYDSCFSTAGIDPSCPNYKPKLPDTITAAEIVVPELKSHQENSEEQATARRMLESEQTKKAQALKKSSTNVLANTATAQALEAASVLPKVYNISLFGGTYSDSIKLLDKRLPDSRNSQRLSSSQELLHTRMVDQQYNRGTKND